MVSPSSTTLMRSTPCVAGCCGPMFRGSGSPCSGSSPSGRGPASGAAVPQDESGEYSNVCVLTLMALEPALEPVVVELVRLDALVGEVLAQREVVVGLGHQQALELAGLAAVAEEHDAEHVEALALAVLRARPEIRHRVDARRHARQAREQAQAVVVRDREQLPPDLEARLGRVAVDGGDEG